MLALVDGSVIVVGGLWNRLDGAVPQYAAIYQPGIGRGTWRNTSLLEFSSASQRFSLAQYGADNSVLQIGGTNEDGLATYNISQSRRYYPSTDVTSSWFPPQRSDHSATRLADGRVLVVGGVSGYQQVGNYMPPIYVAVETAQATLIGNVSGREATETTIWGGEGRVPYVATAGERFYVSAAVRSLAPSMPLPQVTGSVVISDGGSSCSFQLPAQRCELTVVTSGQRTLTASYVGDATNLPSSGTMLTAPPSTLRISRRGPGDGSVNGTPLSFTEANVRCPGVNLGPFPVVGCWSTLVPGTVLTLRAAANSGSAFTGWLGACVGDQQDCIVTVPPQGVIDVSATFARNSDVPISLDVDGSGAKGSLTDVFLIHRFLSFMHDSALINNALHGLATRRDPRAIEDYLSAHRPAFDIDANGVADVNDGLLLIRYSMGFRGDPLVSGLVSPNTRRTTSSAIELTIATLLQ
ncbi:MAG: hypothetical protein ABL985_05610 [Casimicrobium sp.]